MYNVNVILFRILFILNRLKPPHYFKKQPLIPDKYCLNIITDRMYRLLKAMNLPKNPFPRINAASADENCTNILKRRFSPAKPSTAWIYDMTWSFFTI